MVSVTLIFGAFEYVAKSPFLIMERLVENYTFSLISPCCLTWYPSKLVTLGKMVATRWFLEGSLYHSSLMLTIFHTSSPPFPHILGFLGSLTPRRACTSFHGKKRLKA
jgi:hypothetical protein